MNLKRKVVPFDVKVAGDGPGSFEGYAACTKNLDRVGDIIAPGAFAQDLEKFLSEGFIGGLNHDWDKPIGKPMAASEDGKGLKIGAKLIDCEHARECRTYMNEGIVKKLSIGYSAMGKMFLETQGDVETYWSQTGYIPDEDEKAASKFGATVLTRVKLYEASPVLRAANDHCDITASKSGAASPGRLTLDDHFLSALGTVEDFAARFAAFHERKQESGRPVPPARIAQFARIFDAMAGMKAKLAAVRPDPADLRRMQADALALEASLLEIAV